MIEKIYDEAKDNTQIFVLLLTESLSLHNINFKLTLYNCYYQKPKYDPSVTVYIKYNIPCTCPITPTIK